MSYPLQGMVAAAYMGYNGFRRSFNLLGPGGGGGGEWAFARMRNAEPLKGAGYLVSG